MIARSLPILPLLLATACTEAREASIGTSDRALIQDATHDGGRAGFYFLPPMVEATPLPPTYDGSLALEARLEGPSGTIITAPFTARPWVQGYDVIIDTAAVDLDPAIDYRLRVFTGALELGFGDVRVFTNWGEAKSLATNDNFELVDGAKLKVMVYANRCAAVTCDSPPACHEGGVCDPTNGTCSYTPVTNARFDCARFDEAVFDD